MLLAAIAAAFILLQHFSGDDAQNALELSQMEFKRAVAEGQVAEVVRVRDTGTGSTFLEGRMAIRKDAAAADGNEPRQEEGNTAKKSFIARMFGGEKAPPQKQGEPFRVNLVPGENEKLMEFLEARGVACPVKEREALIGPFMMQIIYLLLFVGLLWFLFYRRIGGAGSGGIFTMGKSKTRLLNENKNKVTFKNVAGADEAKEETGEIIEFLKSPDKFTKLGGRIPKGVLLVGPPGTGKTLLARAIAGEADVPFFSISGSDFEEMFVGVGASRVRDMFEQGKKSAPCLIFIDEIDAVGHKRSESAMTGGHMANDQTLNAMLVEMDGFDSNDGVIIIAATNRPDILDPALLRPGRFDRQIYMDLPTLKGREEILHLHGSKVKLGADADLSRIARGTPGFSGADLANLVNEAALLAARKNLDSIPHEILEEARDKVLWGRERRSAGYSRKERETTAWHEAGHALLQLLLPNTDPLHKVTIIPRGRALGATMSLPDHDVLNRTKSQFLDEIVVCAGGRIAEGFFTNDISTGAAQDIREATRIARNMVCRFGMSETFGFQAFQNPNPFAAEETPPPYSTETASAIDAEVKKIIDNAFAKAGELLEANRDKLELLAKTLLEKETMDGRDIEKLLGIARQTDKDTPDGNAADEGAEDAGGAKDA
ncbi:MAG: ATP-dependent zinc metalloprotease FtsH [Kiritimatiellae bacterium]|nr:ATP-dependent zinc metalloprotease FtsH [Kiritimatiellia bacterium]